MEMDFGAASIDQPIEQAEQLEAGIREGSYHEITVRAVHNQAPLVFRKGSEGAVRIYSKGEQLMKLMPNQWADFLMALVRMDKL